MNFIGKYQARDTNFCDALISFYEESSFSGPATILSIAGETVIDTSVKDADTLTIDLFDDQKVIKDYLKILISCTEAYKNEYIYCDKYAKWGISEKAVIQKYSENSKGFIYHTERFTSKLPAVNRHLVFMTYLNEVSEGGETEFYYQKTIQKPQKGLTLIWPADWTHTHRGNPIKNQNKYIVSGWFSFI